MSFNIALSGINAAQKDLDVTANNISNVNTYGFKESRAEFADVYSASVFSNAATTVGQGVTTKAVAQQFSQGSFLFTNNSLDLAVDGSGFFAMSAKRDDLDVTLTRAGAFKLNSEGYVTNSSGQFLRVFPVNPDGTVSSVSLASAQALQIPSSAGNPQATESVTMSMNLPAGAKGLDVNKFDPADNTTYTSATSLTVYDSLGQSYVTTTYYVKDANTPNRWAVFYSMTDSGGVKPLDITDSNNSLNDFTTTVVNGSGTVTANLDGADQATYIAAGQPSNYVVDVAEVAAAAPPTPAQLQYRVLDGSGTVLHTSANFDAGTIPAPAAIPKADTHGVEITFADSISGPSKFSISPAQPVANGMRGAYVDFNADGSVRQVNGGNPVVSERLGADANIDLGGSNPDQTLTFDFRAPTQFASPFEVTQLTQDGVTVGRLVSVDIASTGLVSATYSNGLTSPLGKIALVKVASEQGLSPLGNTSWRANAKSGEPIAGEADQGSYGRILSGTLEQSNVNLTSELVDLITAQRNFQANSRALEANNTVTQAILQIR